MRRDRLTFAMIIGIPIIQLVLFGYAINTDPKQLPTGDRHRRSGAGRARDHRRHADAPAISTSTGVCRRREARASARRRRRSPSSSPCPPDFHARPRRAASGRRSSSRPTPPIPPPPPMPSRAMPEIVRRAVASRDRRPARAACAPARLPVEVVVHRLYNPEGDHPYNIVPGLLGTILTMTTTLMTALALTREIERGTMENLLAMPVRPVRDHDRQDRALYRPRLPAGGGHPRRRLAALRRADGGLAAAAPARRVLLFIAANVTLGYTFSTLARTQMQAMQMTFFFFLPSILLSGFMFPFRGMPGWAQVIGEVLPLTHFLRVVRGIMLKGNDLVADAAASLADRRVPARDRRDRAAALPAHAGLMRLVLLCDTGAGTAAGGDTPGVACGGSGYSGLTSIAQGPGMHRRLAVAAIAAVLAVPCQGADPRRPMRPARTAPTSCWSSASVAGRARPTKARTTICCSPGRSSRSAICACPLSASSAEAGDGALHSALRSVTCRRATRTTTPTSRASTTWTPPSSSAPRSATATACLRGFATLRQGFGGHHGVVGEVGVDVIFEPLPKLERQPRPAARPSPATTTSTPISASTAEQSAASGLREFDPDGGVKGVGLEAEARYALTPPGRWSANAGYERLIGDAADSPVTDVGSENQFTAGARPDLPLRARPVQVAPLGTGRSPMICRTPLSGPSKLPAKARAASPAPSRAFVNLTYRPLPLCLAA